MTLKVFNTETRKLETFEPIRPNEVGIYICGPTVYDYSHIGHARTYVAFDVIVRYLRYRGFRVKQVTNITDIDDKIINRAIETGRDPLELAREFEKYFLEDIRALGVEESNVYPRVSDHIPEIVKIIQTLLEKEFAYQVEGNVYFDVTKIRKFGRLSRQSLDDLRAGARVEVDEKKRNPADFVLWKKAKSSDPSWDSPWGKGRPGWHIECSAMSMKYLGEQFDIHGGAKDLIFPHHENELVIAEAYSGKEPFAKYWLHTGFLTIKGKKMAKSLGNFITVRELLSRYEAEVFRLFILSTHYRRPVDFSEEALTHSKQALEGIYNTVTNLRKLIETIKEDSTPNRERERELRRLTLKVKQKFLNAMDNDFNTARALTKFFELIKIGNEAVTVKTSKETLTTILETINELQTVLGLLPSDKKDRELSAEIERLIAERDLARKNKDWAKADEIRAKLKKMGITLRDYADGTIWVKE